MNMPVSETLHARRLANLRRLLKPRHVAFIGGKVDNRSGDSMRPPFFSILVNQVRELALVEVIYDLGGSERGALVHAHIQRPFCPEAETPLWRVDLHL